MRLYFAEPDELEIGGRLFDVSLQGKQVLKDFDVAEGAGAQANRCVVREFRGIVVKDDLRIAFTSAANSDAGPTLSGIEIIAEGW